MIVQNLTGDLLAFFKAGHFDAIAHGANCFSKMGAGIAHQIKNEFPVAYQADKNCQFKPEDRLGKISSAKTPYGIIFNLYTQYNPGRNFDIAALKLCVGKLENFLPEEFCIGIPEIGCGIGGGNWEEVKKVFEGSFLKFIVVKWKND